MLYIQNIFIPDENKLQKSLNSINSLKEYLIKYNHNLDIYIGGYIRKPEFIEPLNKTMKELPNCSFTSFDKNYGKAYVTNALALKAINEKNNDYILLADYDIVFMLEDEYLFDRLLEVPEQTKRYKNCEFGMVALNQSEQNCHVISVLQNHSFKYINKYGKEENILWHPYPGYIGGGCIFTPTAVWKKVNGYRVMGVYAGDDAYYLLDMKNNKLSWQLIESLHIKHPSDTDVDYHKFKCSICAKITNGTNRIPELDKFIGQMDEFWNKR